MSRNEPLEIDVKGGVVQVLLRLPEPSSSGHPFPTVLICRGLHVEGDDAAGFFDDLTDALAAAGIAAARFEHRASGMILDDFDTHSAADELDDVQAVYDRLISKGVDRQQIGVIGYGLGAIAAAGLVRQVPEIARLCLIAPTTAEHLRSNLTQSNGSPAALDPSRIPKSYMAAMEHTDSPGDVASSNRPTLVVHGAADRFIDQDVSLEYLRAVEAAGHDITRILIARADHVFTSPSQRAACIGWVSRFFAAMIQQPVAAGQP